MPQSSSIHANPYQIVQSILTNISDTHLRQELSEAVDELVAFWTSQLNRLIEALNCSQSQQAVMQYHLVDQTNRYHKSVRETQFYRQKYIQTAERLALVLQPQPSLSKSASLNSALSHLSLLYPNKDSCNSSYSALPTPYSIISNVFSTGIYHFDSRCQTIKSVLMLQDAPAQYADDLSSSSSSSSSSSTLNHNDTCNPNDIDTTDTMKSPQQLVYACGDGFWDTIAHGKNDKNNVALLVSNYLRRGGQPNVAKASPTVKLVKEGYGLIHALVVIKNTCAMQQVLEAGADPNALPLCPLESDCIPPLILAARMGYLKGVKILLEKAHANIYQHGPLQETALHAAAQVGALDIVTYLTQQMGMDAFIVNKNGASVLHYACMSKTTDVVKFLIRNCHLPTDVQDDKGETPLHYAIRHRLPKTVAKLIELGAHLNYFVSKQTPTPLDLAKMTGQKSITTRLRKAGAKTTKEMEKASQHIIQKNNTGHINRSASDLSSNPSVEKPWDTKIRSPFHILTHSF